MKLTVIPRRGRIRVEDSDPFSFLFFFSLVFLSFRCRGMGNERIWNGLTGRWIFPCDKKGEMSARSCFAKIPLKVGQDVSNSSEEGCSINLDRV